MCNSFFPVDIPNKDEAFAKDKTHIKYNFPISVTLRQQLNVKLSNKFSYIVDCIKVGNKLVFSESYSRLISCNSDGTGVHYISLLHQPGCITEIDIDTVAVSCFGKTILMIKISTTTVISTIKTSKYCRAISYSDNKLYVAHVVNNNSIIEIMDLTGKVIRTIPLPSKGIVDITVNRGKIICINETSIYCCSLDGKLLWKFKDKMYQSLNRLTTDDENNVYVADLNSITVFFVSSDGNQYRELLSESDGLNMTSLIHFDKKENVLLVCSNVGGKAFLFDIKTEQI